MTKVLVLGSGGMLGSMLVRVLGASSALEVSYTARGPGDPTALPFDAARDSAEALLEGGDWEWVINAIGVTSLCIDEQDPESVAHATEVNGVFPHRLAAAARRGQSLIFISTDGVFSGAEGPYDEGATPDAADLYGISKSKGEVTEPSALQLRCSIIGPEPPPPRSLLGWALSQPQGSRIDGYTNQRWSGITTWHFARLCEGVISGRAGDPPSPLHVVPDDSVSKAELLRLVLDAFGRGDVEVSPREAAESLNRCLSTRRPESNRALWTAAGYDQPPTVAAMVEELAAVAGPASPG